MRGDRFQAMVPHLVPHFLHGTPCKVNYIDFKKMVRHMYHTTNMVPHVPHFVVPRLTTIDFKKMVTHLVPHIYTVPHVPHFVAHFVVPRRVYKLQGDEKRVIEAS